MANLSNVEGKFIEKLEEALERDAGNVKMEDFFRDYPEWDSLSVLVVLAMINEEFDVTIPRQEFDKILTIRQLYDFIIQ